jgi:hypothetical protein
MKLNNSALILIDRDGGNQFFYKPPFCPFFGLKGFYFGFLSKERSL